MQHDEVQKLVDLVAAKVEDRFCAKGTAPQTPSEAERLARLRADLQSLAIQFSARDQVIAQVRAEIAEHGFLVDKKGYQDGERLRPPDFGPQGPSDEDIQYEIEEILRKIERLRTPKQEDDYQFKLPFRVQINVALLVSILIELLKLIMKLLERIRRGPQPSSTKRA